MFTILGLLVKSGGEVIIYVSGTFLFVMELGGGIDNFIFFGMRVRVYFIVCFSVLVMFAQFGRVNCAVLMYNIPAKGGRGTM